MYHGGTDRRQWGPKTNAYPGKVLANANQSPISLDAMDAQFGTGSVKKATPAAVAATSPTSIDSMDAQFTDKPTAQAQHPIAAGLKQGAHDVLDKPAEWMTGKE
jgi:hypothetical protein